MIVCKLYFASTNGSRFVNHMVISLSSGINLMKPIKVIYVTFWFLFTQVIYEIVQKGDIVMCSCILKLQIHLLFLKFRNTATYISGITITYWPSGCCVIEYVGVSKHYWFPLILQSAQIAMRHVHFPVPSGTTNTISCILSSSNVIHSTVLWFLT